MPRIITLVKAIAWIVGVSVLVSAVIIKCIDYQFQHPGVIWHKQISGHVVICCILPALPIVYLLEFLGMPAHEAECAVFLAPIISGVLTWFMWVGIRKRVTRQTRKHGHFVPDL